MTLTLKVLIMKTFSFIFLLNIQLQTSLNKVVYRWLLGYYIYRKKLSKLIIIIHFFVQGCLFSDMAVVNKGPV